MSGAWLYDPASASENFGCYILYWRGDGTLNLLGDSTGTKFLGDSEWQARKHGVQGRRQSRSVQLAMDTDTSEIRPVEITSSSDGDCPILPDLLDEIPDGEESLTAKRSAR